MSAVSMQDPSFPFGRNLGQLSHIVRPRLCHRWGEYSVIKDGRDNRKCDGLSRYRTNFDCCHEIPLCRDHGKFEGHMLPRPFTKDIGTHDLNMCEMSTERFSHRSPKVDVFPRNQPGRTDHTGDFVLNPTTRSELEKTHKKIFCSPRYDISFPEFETENSNMTKGIDEMDHSTFFHISPLDRKKQPRKRVRFFNDEKIHPSPTPPKMNYHSYVPPPIVPSQLKKLAKEKEMIDMNQNFNDYLLPRVYNYKIPSALHYPEDFMLDIVEEEEDEEQDPNEAPPSRFLRPLIPANLQQEVASFKREIQQASPQIEERDIQPLTGRRMVPSVDTWLNSCEASKLKLCHKSDTQKRHNFLHPEPVPDLRDFKTYSKRMFFHGFNSSAFRG